MKQIIILSIVTLILTVFSNCYKLNYTTTNDNFNQNQANEIIDKTTNNKKRRQRIKEKRQLKEQEQLNDLNNQENKNIKKKHQKPKFIFY